MPSNDMARIDGGHKQTNVLEASKKRLTPIT